MVTSRQLANEIMTAVDRSAGTSQELVSVFVSFLQQKNLLALLPNVLKRVEEHQARRVADEKLYITTAFPVSKEVVEKIRTTVGAGDAQVEMGVDEEVIGGFVARYKGKTYDASVVKITGELAGTLSS